MADSEDAVPTKFENQWFHTQYVENKGSLTWKISGFSLCPKKNGERLSSPLFYISGCERGWKLDVYPKGVTEEYEDCVSVLIDSESKEEVDISCEVSLLDASSDRFNSMSLSTVYAHEKVVGFRKYIEVSELLKDKNHLLPNDELIILCTISMIREVQNEGKGDLKWPQVPSRCDEPKGVSLSSDLRKLYEDMKFYDVVLKCGDAQINAHKIILVSRSYTFAALLKLDMQNANKTTLDISDMEIEVLREMVRFIYSDGCSFYDVDFVMKLLQAADNYDIPSLKSKCAEYLEAHMSEKNVLDMVCVADVAGQDQLRMDCVALICERLSSVAIGSGKLQAKPHLLEEMLKHLAQEEREEEHED